MENHCCSGLSPWKSFFFARLETQYLKRLYENYASSQFSLSRLHLVLVEVNTFKLLNPNGCMKVPWKGHSWCIPNTRGPTKLNAGRRIFALYSEISIICLVLAQRSDLNSVNPVLGAQCGAESGKWASTWRAGIFPKAVTWLAIGHFWSQIPHRCPAWCSHPAFNTSSEPGWVLRMDQAQSNWNTNKIKTFTYV